MHHRSRFTHQGWLLGTALLLDATSASAFFQSPKPPITPPVVKSTNLPDLDLFAPTTKKELPPKPISTRRPNAAWPVRASSPQAPRFAPNGPAPTALPVTTPAVAPSTPPQIVEKPAGKPPEPLPPIPKVDEPPPKRAADPEVEAPWGKTNGDAIYRPLAAVVMESEAQRGGGETLWKAVQAPSPLPQSTPLPELIPCPSDLVTSIEERPDVSSPVDMGNRSDHWLTVAPSGLLWAPPLANPREPRTSAKWLQLDSDNVIDAAVGGQFGLLRIAPDGKPHEGFQLDLFAAAFSRFDGSDLLALDYRFGVPLTWATGCWRFKVAYEKTWSEFQFAALDLEEFDRDEIVLGVARQFADNVRAYGQIGTTISGSQPQTNDRFRYNIGAEWADRTCTTPSGSPFAAVDVEFRGDQNYEPNVTVQAGWNWRGRVPGRGPRLAGEYHSGNSPFGQFSARSEDWYGVVAAFDW